MTTLSAPAAELFTAAIGYASRGWRVYPCRESGPRAKSPYLNHGHLDASRDPDVIREFWTRWPRALKPGKAADVLSVSCTVIYELMRVGEVDSLQIGRSRRVTPEALRAYIGRLQAEQAAASP